jgi:cell division inhibitor SulA/protein ImuA
MSADQELARLLEHPSIWRGRSAARRETLPTGFGALDERLPGRGWPRTGLIEILVPRFGIGELSLLLPALASLTRGAAARWCVWVAPPANLFAPALEAHGLRLDRVLVVRADRSSRVRRTASSASGRIPSSIWACEQTLGSGACDAVLNWTRHRETKALRRLQLAAERGRTLGVLFRPAHMAAESTPAILRLLLAPKPCAPSREGELSQHGVLVTLLKSRGGVRRSVEIELRSKGS